MISSFLKYTVLTIIITLGLTGCDGGNNRIIQDMPSIPPSPSKYTPQYSPKKEANTIIPAQEIRLGLLLPLTGPDASIGQALLNAATLALFDSGDRRLMLLPFDTKGTAQGAALAINKLSKQNPDLIIGPVFAHSIAAIKPQAQSMGVNIIGFSSDHTLAGNGVFLLNFPIEEQIERVVTYASAHDYARYATLIPQTPYGTRALEIFKASVKNHNRTLTAIEFYTPDSTKLVNPVLRISNYKERHKAYLQEIRFLKKLGVNDSYAQEMLDELKNKETIGDVDFDAILLPEGGTMLTTLAAWVSYYEIDTTKIKLLGTGLWDDEMLFLEPQLYGGWFAAPDHTQSQKFLNRYQKICHQDSPRIATLAYDAVAFAATLVRQAKVPDFTIEKLTNVNGFIGIDGLFRFAKSGLIERGLAIYEVGPKEFTIIAPAPKNFIEIDKKAALWNSHNSTQVSPETTRNPMPKSSPKGYSIKASPAPSPADDDRPFPYNPVQKDAVSNYY